MFPKWGDWDVQYTRKGFIRQKVKQALKVFAFTASIVGLYSIRKISASNGTSLLEVIKSMLKQGLSVGLGAFNKTVTWLEK